MSNQDPLVKAIESAIWELTEALRDLPDEDVWVRPHPRLLSVGELVAHIAHGEANWLLGKSFPNKLASTVARYYTLNVEVPLELELGASDLQSEMLEVHRACMDALAASPVDHAAPYPYREEWTWGSTLEYQAFHIAYHTGQIYSVRHLFGHTTVDN